MRVLITGGNGYVAGSLLTQAPTDWDVHALSTRTAPNALPASVQWHRMNPLEPEALQRTLQQITPQSIIHTAAMAGIDACEQEREQACQVNVEYTRYLASYAASARARLVYLSTDNVFNGTLRPEDPPYSENALPRPVNYYGETKRAAEEIVAALDTSWVVARVALVMGLPRLGSGNAFLSWMLPKWEQGKAVGAPSNEIRTPIDVVTLGRALLELATHDYVGYLHLAGNDRLNRFELIRRMAAVLGYPESLVYENDPTQLPNRAERPRDVSLDNTLSRSLLHTHFPDLNDAIHLAAGR